MPALDVVLDPPRAEPARRSTLRLSRAVTPQRAAGCNAASWRGRCARASPATSATRCRYAWCTDRDLHPLAARRHDIALWARQLANTPQRSGKTEAPASIARRLSCLSSFYGYGVQVDVLEENPVANVKRPRVANAPMTVGLARGELEQLLDTAQGAGPRSAALITLLAYNGLHIDEALSRDVEHLGHRLGHRVLRISRKGGRDALEPLSPPVERTLDRYLAGRTSGPLFLDDHGRRMYEAQAWRLVRRLARAAPASRRPAS